MKYPPRFWSETIPRLTDVSVAALLQALADAPKHLPRGVVQSSAAVWSATRYAWAAEHITAEIATAAGVTVDQRVELAVVWEVATSELPTGPRAAIGWGQRLAQTQASFAGELGRRLRSMMGPASQEGFDQGIKSAGGSVPRGSKVVPRPRADPFEAELHVAKGLEHQLRASFDDLDDLGATPRAADRRAFVQALAAGFDAEQIMDALRGRADKSRRSRRWKDIDTAQVFLRLVWICGSTRRLQESEQVGSSLRQEQGLVIGDGGRRFINGREIVGE